MPMFPLPLPLAQPLQKIQPFPPGFIPHLPSYYLFFPLLSELLLYRERILVSLPHSPPSCLPPSYIAFLFLPKDITYPVVFTSGSHIFFGNKEIWLSCCPVQGSTVECCLCAGSHRKFLSLVWGSCYSVATSHVHQLRLKAGIQPGTEQAVSVLCEQNEWAVLPVLTVFYHLIYWSTE